MSLGKKCNNNLKMVCLDRIPVARTANHSCTNCLLQDWKVARTAAKFWRVARTAKYFDVLHELQHIDKLNPWA